MCKYVYIHIPPHIHVSFADCFPPSFPPSLLSPYIHIDVFLDCSRFAMAACFLQVISDCSYGGTNRCGVSAGVSLALG